MQKLNNVKVIFVDIDGTLTNSKKEVTLKTSEVIAKVVQKGISIVLCSGRSNQYTQIKSRLANASSQIISSNGSQIYDYLTNEVIYKNIISKDVLKKVMEYINSKEEGFILNCSDIRYGNKYLMRKMNPGDKIIKNLNEIENKDVYQLVIETNSYDKMTEMINYIKNNSELEILNCSRAYINGLRNESHYYIDVNDIKSSKGNAIKEYLNAFNVAKEDAMCFGDHINDTSMFNSCGIKVAMGNANDELKAKADYVTLTNDEDGVAYFLSKYVL